MIGVFCGAAVMWQLCVAMLSGCLCTLLMELGFVIFSFSCNLQETDIEFYIFAFYLLIYICIYIFMCIFIYLHFIYLHFICTYIYIYIFAYIFIYLHFVYLHFKYLHFICIYIYIYLHIYVYICILYICKKLTSNFIHEAYADSKYRFAVKKISSKVSYKILFLKLFFSPQCTTCPYGLRGPRSWTWQECYRLLRLGRP